jgi:EthD domain-containing protein
MKTIFATFNFKNTNLAAAEKQYIEDHVQLTLRLPNLRQYITGLVRPHPDRPSPHRAAFNYFDDDAALRWALHKSPAARPLLADGAAHLRVNRWLELDSEIMVPFESRRPGLQCFVMATEFELKVDGCDDEAAEQRYLNYHVELARQLPNLRHYMISKYQVSRQLGASAAAMGNLAARNPLRMAMFVFDSFEALCDACQSPLGKKLNQNEQATMAIRRVYHIDATVQL